MEWGELGPHGWRIVQALRTYYPRVRRLQLLLPLCLVSDEHVDLALAVEKPSSGSYLGRTVLSRQNPTVCGSAS